MSWNQARTWLVATNWHMVDRSQPLKRTTSDQSVVRILDLERQQLDSTAKCNPEAVYAWLQQHGFSISLESNAGNQFHCGDIEVDCDVKDTEVAGIILTFTLTRESQTRIRIWNSLVEQLCDSWSLQLYDPRRDLLAKSTDFGRVLSETQSWKEFAASFDWPATT